MVKEVGQRVDAGNVKTIIMPDKKFEEHMMYDAKKAESPKEHNDLKKDGYSHSKSGFKMRTPFQCWKGYTAGGRTKPSPSGKKTPEGNTKMVPDCKPE